MAMDKKTKEGANRMIKPFCEKALPKTDLYKTPKEDGTCRYFTHYSLTRHGTLAHHDDPVSCWFCGYFNIETRDCEIQDERLRKIRLLVASKSKGQKELTEK